MSHRPAIRDRWRATWALRIHGPSGRCSAQLGQLRADGAEQEVVNYLASPEQVHLPQQQSRGGLLPGGRSRRACQPGRGEPERGGNHAVPAHRDLHLSQASRARRRGDLTCCHGHAGPKSEYAQLSQARQHLCRAHWPPPDRNIGDAQHAARTQHPVTLFEKGLTRAEMERGLHADDSIDGRLGDRQPGGVPATAAASASLRRSRPAISCHSVMLTATSRRGRTTSAISGSWVPSPFPASRITPPAGSADASVVTTGGKRPRPHPPNPAPPTGPGSASPAPGPEELRPDALVNACGRIPALPEHRSGMPRMLACPSRDPRRLRCHPTPTLRNTTRMVTLAKLGVRRAPRTPFTCCAPRRRTARRRASRPAQVRTAELGAGQVHGAELGAAEVSALKPEPRRSARTKSAVQRR